MLIKGKTLRRRTTILKHGRFLQNLTVVPNFPADLEPVEEAKALASGEEELQGS